MSIFRTCLGAAVRMAVAAACSIAFSPLWPAHAAELDEPLILVAKRTLRDALYGETILIAKPIGNDSHVGFIVNRPTAVTLGRIFPDHGPSHKVADPVYLGGPFNSQFIFALVQRGASPGAHAVQMAGDLYLVIDAESVDRIIEADAEHARFLAGLVAWRPGELHEELKRGLWHVLDAESDLVMRRQTEGLWEELVQRSEQRANGI